MIRESDLMRMSNRITDYLRPHVVLTGANKWHEMTELFDQIHNFFPGWVIMTCAVMHPDMHYISRNSEQIFGPEHERNNDLNDFFRQVHDADQEDLHACFANLHEFLEMIPPALHYQYRGILHYRFRKQDGQYIYLHDEKAVLNFPNSGNLYFALLKDVTPEKRFEGVKLEIFNLLQPSVILRTFKPSANRRYLTKREADLVGLIKQGLSTKEIAWYLKISHHTVRNTKSKLFEKFKVNNTVELLNMTVN